MAEDRPGILTQPHGTGIYTSNEVPSIHARELTLQGDMRPELKNNLRYQFEQMAADHVAPNPERIGSEPPNLSTLGTQQESSAPADHSSGRAQPEDASSADVAGPSSTACAPARLEDFPGQSHVPTQNYNPNAGPSGVFAPGITSILPNATRRQGYLPNAPPQQGHLPPGYKRGSSHTPCVTCGGLNWRYSHQNACKVEM